MPIPLEDQVKNGDADDAGSACSNAARDPQEESVKCPRCGYSFITKTSGKQKLRTRVLVFVENGNVMGICPKCKANLKVPVSLRGNATGENPGISRRQPGSPNSKPGGAEGAAS